MQQTWDPSDPLGHGGLGHLLLLFTFPAPGESAAPGLAVPETPGAHSARPLLFHRAAAQKICAWLKGIQGFVCWAECSKPTPSLWSLPCLQGYLLLPHTPNSTTSPQGFGTSPPSISQPADLNARQQAASLPEHLWVCIKTVHFLVLAQKKREESFPPNSNSLNTQHTGYN